MSIYFNTASAGILPKESQYDLPDLLSELTNNPSNIYQSTREDYIEPITANFQKLIDAEQNTTAVIPNFSYGISSFVTCLSKNSKVLLYKHDYPSLIEPFKINLFPVIWFDHEEDSSLSVSKIKELILHHKINVLAISHIQYLTGFMLNLKELGEFCRKHHVLLIVDATQSTSAIPLSVQQNYIDVLLTSNYKWLNAGFGSGFIYISPAAQQKHVPKIGGFGSYEWINSQWELTNSIRRYEPGHQSLISLFFLKKALESRLEISVAKVYDHNINLANYFLNHCPSFIEPLKWNTSQTSIISFPATQKMYKKLHDKKIITTYRANKIRLSFHYHNSINEIDKMINVLND